MLAGLTALVTGTSGFMGSWLACELVERGARVVALDRQKPAGSPACRLAAAVQQAPVDLEDFDLVHKLLGEHEVDLIFHLAAQALVGEAQANPLATFRANIAGTWNLLEAARLLHVKGRKLKGLLVASSDKAYGDQSELPYREEAPMCGRYPYDVSKSCADLLARSYYHSFALPVIVTRCGNLFGGGDLHFSRLVPGTIRSALRGERPLIRSDGRPVRDYIYVRDAVLAMIALAERLVDGSLPQGEAFNISTESPLSVSEMAARVLKACGREDLTPVIENSAKLEIERQFLSAEKLRKAAGWRHVYSLDDALAETVAWYREYLGQQGPFSRG